MYASDVNVFFDALPLTKFPIKFGILFIVNFPATLLND